MCSLVVCLHAGQWGQVSSFVGGSRYRYPEVHCFNRGGVGVGRSEEWVENAGGGTAREDRGVAVGIVRNTSEF